ncbi:MAG: helix-turn-helix domain-containing protein [Cellulosilyticaceae bacterium]
MIIGKNIKALREGLGLTQEQLAEKLSISSQAVSKWETSQSVPDTMLLPALSKTLGVSIDNLFKENRERYDNLASKLYAIYQNTKAKEDFLQADLAYNRLFSEGNYTADDLFGYGCLYKGYVQNCYQIAEDAFKKTMEMISDETDRVYNLAFDRLMEIRDDKKQIQQVIDELKAKYEMQPESSFFRHKLILAYRIADQDAIAEKMVDEALASGVEEWGLYQSKGDFHLYGRNEIHEAIACYEKAWILDQTFPNTLHTLLCAYKKLGNKEKAIDICHQWIEWYEERGAIIEKQHVEDELKSLQQ